MVATSDGADAVDLGGPRTTHCDSRRVVRSGPMASGVGMRSINQRGFSRGTILGKREWVAPRGADAFDIGGPRTTHCDSRSAVRWEPMPSGVEMRTINQRGFSRGIILDKREWVAPAWSRRVRYRRSAYDAMRFSARSGGSPRLQAWEICVL